MSAAPSANPEGGGGKSPPWVPGVGFAPIRWWATDPRPVGWAAAVAAVLVVAFSSQRTFCGSLSDYGFRIAFFAFILLWIASAVQGLRRPEGRRVGRVTVMFLVPVFGMLLFTPLMNETQPRARIAGARMTVRTLGESVTMFRNATGKLPARLEELTVATIGMKGERVGVFVGAVPGPYPCWTSYRYEIHSGDAFTITATGDGAIARYPER